MSKTFSSKSIDHIKSYPLVQQSTNYILSYKLAQVFSTYAIALTNYANANVVSKVYPVADLLAFADAKFDSLVLANFDVVLARAGETYARAESTLKAYKQKGESIVADYKKKGESIVAAYKSKGEAIVTPYKQKGDAVVAKAQDVALSFRKRGEDTVGVYLKPVNDYAVLTVDKVLPKLKKAAAESKQAAENELAKLLEIVNDTFERSKDLLTSKLSELQNAVIATYNKEFDAAPEKNYYAKVATASVSTGVQLLKSVNLDYIQPLRASTQSLVSDTIATTETQAQAGVEKAQELVNANLGLNGLALNIPVVSASA